MTLLLFSLLLLYPEQSSPNAHELTWHIDFASAQEEAQAQDKSILLVFSGSDWCKPCIRLKEEVFDSQAFKAVAQDRWSLLKIDFPRRKKNQVSDNAMRDRNAMAEKYNPKGLFPYVLVLNAEGTVQENITYKGGGVASFLSELE